MKRLVMSADMKVAEARPLANLILDACKKIGVDVLDGGYQNIREALINNKCDFHSELQNLVVREAMSRHVKNHGF